MFTIPTSLYSQLVRFHHDAIVRFTHLRSMKTNSQCVRSNYCAKLAQIGMELWSRMHFHSFRSQIQNHLLLTEVLR